MIRLRVPKARVTAELEARVPRTLADAKRQPLGAAGRLSYRITRGDFEVAADRGALKVSTRARARIEVCKPFAGTCVRYGRCEPELEIAVRIPIELDRLPLSSTVQTRTARGCILGPVGLDMTGRMEEVIEREAHSLERRIDATLRTLTRDAKLEPSTVQPLELSREHCVEPELESIEQAPLTEIGPDLALPLIIDGHLRVVPSCSRSRTTRLPPLGTTPRIPAVSALRVLQDLEFSTMDRGLLESLAELPSGVLGRITDLRIHGPVAAHRALGVQVAFDGPSCGVGSIFTELTARAPIRPPLHISTVGPTEPEEWTLRVKRAWAAPGQELPLAITTTLERNASMRVAASFTRELDAAIEQRLKESIAIAPVHLSGLGGRWSLDANVAPASIRHLRLAWSRHGTLDVWLRQARPPVHSP